MIQDPHWTPLSHTLATLCSRCGILYSCPLLPSRRPRSLPLVWLCGCVCRWLVLFPPLVQFPLPSLRREKSGAQLVERVFSGVPS